VTFNNPAASAWKGAAFDIDISDSDAGSGLASCEYMVESYDGSTWVTTQWWAARTCNSASSKSITVGAAAMCRDEGADTCRVTVRATDNVSKVTTLAARLFSIDWTPPVVVFNNPAASAWKGAAFDIDISDSDAGSGLASCEYMVESYDGATWVETQAWSARTVCNSTTSQSITVGAAAMCRNQGADLCRVTVRATDNVGKVTTLAARTFSIDWAPPAISAISLTSSNEAYYYGTADGLDCATNINAYPAVTCSTWFNSISPGGGGGQVVTANVSWSDTGTMYKLSGATAFGITPADDTVGPIWTIQYTVPNNHASDEDGVDFTVYDRAGNTDVVKIDFKLDNTAPTTTINNPAASSWQGLAGFTVDVTNADAGSGLASCYYRVVSNGVQTLGWTGYSCGTDPAITVGDTGGLNCDVEGADKCQVEFYNTDRVSNGTPADAVARVFSIDWASPTVTINSPAASSWQGAAGFTVDVTNADTGSGVNTCYYRVVSDGTQTLPALPAVWQSYTCNTDPVITVGAAGNCNVEGTNKCHIEFYNTDLVGNIGVTVTRDYSIDWQPPVIDSGAFSESNDYMWISPSDGKLYYGTGMAAAQSFQIAGTAHDTGSGLARAAFSTAYGDSPADDLTADNWSAPYDIDSGNVVADPVTVTVYDAAGNSANATYTPVSNNNLSVQYLAMSPTGPPAFVQFRLFYPDGVTEMTTNGADGLHLNITGGSDVSQFIHIYNKVTTPEDVFDDVADASDQDFVLSTLNYQNGCGTASGNAWCMEVYTVGCASCLMSPHYIGVFGSNIRGDAFYTNIPEEKTIDGDFGAMPGGRPPYQIGDPGTVEIESGPDHMRVYTTGDGLITEDSTLSAWCDCGVCCPTCSAGWCAVAPSIVSKPDFIKENGVLITNIADDTAPGPGQWSWDTSDKKIILGDDPAALTVTATLNGQSEQVCVELINGCGSVSGGSWGGETISLTLSQAPGSGKDITRSDANGSQGFDNITDPAAGFAPADQLTVKGDLKNGKACVTLTANDMPTDNPKTPIKITPTYFGSQTLTYTRGQDIPAYVLIRENTGITPGTTTFAGISDVTNDIFVPTPNTTAQSIVLSPQWRPDGGKLGFTSRQSNPCNGTAATGDQIYTDFNLFTFDQAAGVLDGCRRLTSNGNDGIDNTGVAPYSEVTWDQSGDRMIFAAADVYTGGTGQTKLFWVSATGTVAGIGNQYDYPPAGPAQTTEILWNDITAGANTIDIAYNPVTPIDINKKVLVYETDPITGAVTKNEIKTVTSVTHDPMNGITTLGVNPVMAQGFTGMLGGGSSFVDYPVTLRQLGQAIVPLANAAKWLDPDMSGNYAECDAAYRNKLLAVRIPSDISEDTQCSLGACATDANSSTAANIVMISGATDADGLYRIESDTTATSDLIRVTQFPADNSIWALKPKWSPDCKMIAFMAWDRSSDPLNPPAPSKTGIYIINLSAAYAGFTNATLPITSLTDAGVYKVYDYTTKNMPAYAPNWSADAKIVSYSVDTTNTLNLQNVNSGMSTIVNDLFGSANYDSFLEYILDQPTTAGEVYAPQLVGQVNYNELTLTQCPSNAASTCPNKPNTPYVQVSQMASGAGAYLRMLTMSNESTVSGAGGLLFQDGIVTAVFPPNVIASDTVFFNTTPTAYCGGANPSLLNPDCTVDPTTEYIVQAGEAREYFPDGTNFKSYVRLIFHYCDNDNDGYVDAGTEGITHATSYNTKNFTFDPIANTCAIDGAGTSGGTVPVDSLAVYNWDAANTAWLRMDGVVDKTAKTLTVFSRHFSRYDTLGFRNGFAPAQLSPIVLNNIHTYPNPYVQSKNLADGIKFSAEGPTGQTGITVEIKVYDLRGSLVTTLIGAAAETADTRGTQKVYTLYDWGRPVNASGRPLASGVYMYYLTARNSAYNVTYKGKLSVVR